VVYSCVLLLTDGGVWCGGGVSAATAAGAGRGDGGAWRRSQGWYGVGWHADFERDGIAGEMGRPIYCTLVLRQSTGLACGLRRVAAQ